MCISASTVPQGWNSFHFEHHCKVFLSNEINDKYWARTFCVHLSHLRFMYRIVVLFWYNIQKVFILSNPQEFNNNRQTYIHDIIFCQFIVHWCCLCKKLLMNVPFSIAVLGERSWFFLFRIKCFAIDHLFDITSVSTLITPEAPFYLWLARIFIDLFKHLHKCDTLHWAFVYIVIIAYS